jgi:death-on-curing family protein
VEPGVSGKDTKRWFLGTSSRESVIIQGHLWKGRPLHARLITETGGSHGVRDLGLLQSAIARPQASFEDADLYPDLFTQAAALLDSLIRNHPFVDGNKRTVITAASFFLWVNGLRQP